MNNKEKYIEYVNLNFSGEAKDLLLKQKNYFFHYNCG